MAHEVETQSPAFSSAPLSASARRKRLILLCCEDLRPVACALEAALLGRGWQVDVEFGADARPWVQRAPLERPSVRVLCVPGTVDRALAEQLRAAFAPEPEADLHILGVDDSPGLVQEIERLAGMRTPPRRPRPATPRLSHPTLVETQVRHARSWRVGAAALAAFVVTLGGMSMLEPSTRAPARPDASLGAGITPVTMPRPADLDAEAGSRFHDPVLAAVGPVGLEPLDEPIADDEEIVLLDDDEALPEEPRALAGSTDPGEVRRVDVLATPLAGAAVTGEVIPSVTGAITDGITPPITTGITTPVTGSVAITRPLPTLPAGFLPVAGLPSSDAAPPRRLPAGFLPVAGLGVTAPVTTVDPFATTDGGAEPFATVDPFATAADDAGSP